MTTTSRLGIIVLCLFMLISCDVKDDKSNDDLQVGKCFVTDVDGTGNMCFRIIGDTAVEIYKNSPFDNSHETIDGYKCIKYFGEIVIPETVKYANRVFTVTKIGDYAFFCSDVTSIIIPKTVVSIGESAFQACGKLKKITIPESVLSIGQYSFTGCTSIVSVGLPKNLGDIGEFAFKYCDNLLSITIPSSIDSLKEGVFHGCSSLNSVIIKEGVKYIGDSAYEECTNLTHISIPTSVMGIGLDAFARCSMLTHVDILNPKLNICFKDVFSDCDKLIQDSVIFR